ncbi:MAG: hypothetical protein OXR73_08000 [Myxococcales bacterium]|nr:hypothetical protein [Myxococcales bacterium]
MKKIATTAIALLTFITLTGCGSAQLVQHRADGGRVALSGGYMPSMGKARMVMLEHCEGRFSYTERNDAVDFVCERRAQLAASNASTVATR